MIFSYDDIEFGQFEYIPDNTFVPKLIPSPYETWVAKTESAAPKDDPISQWFRSSSSRNIEVPSTIVLSSEGNVDPVNTEKLFTYWSGDYWPVNGKGFTAQGQKDCNGGELLNYG